jgi:hypothetical protein
LFEDIAATDYERWLRPDWICALEFDAIIGMKEDAFKKRAMSSDMNDGKVAGMEFGVGDGEDILSGAREWFH